MYYVESNYYSDAGNIIWLLYKASDNDNPDKKFSYSGTSEQNQARRYV